MKDKQTSSVIIPEKLQMVCDKSEVSVNEIASLIYHYKNEELRFRDQSVKETELAIKELDRKIAFRKLFIEDHRTAKEYNEIFSPKPVDPEPKISWFKKLLNKLSLKA